MNSYTYHEFFFPSFDDTKLYCREAGDKNKPLLLLIHGALTDSDFFKDTAEILGQWFHVLSYDRRGHVRSELLPGQKTEEVLTRGEETPPLLSSSQILHTHVKDAIHLLQTFGNSNPAYVIGHSLGGSIALLLALTEPSLCKTVLVHEPLPDSAHTLDTERSRVLSAAKELADQGKTEKAVSSFSAILGEPDPRARSATPEEIQNILPDSKMFFFYDYPAFSSSAFVLPQGKGPLPLCFGAGERNQGRPSSVEITAMAKAYRAPVFYFPGGHNCGFDLPQEFAYLSAGILLGRKGF